MKSIILSLLYFSLIFLVISCKEKTENKNNLVSNKINTYAEDAELLDEKLAYTNRVWDSLSFILQRKPTDTVYKNKITKQFKENKEKQIRIYQDFIFNNPNSLLSAETLDNMKFIYDKDVTSKLFNNMSEEIKASDIGLRIKNFIDLYENPKVQDPYIDFELPNQNGELIRLSNHLETYTLIEFWASWCGPCRKSNPELVKIYDKFKSKGFTIVGVSVDDNKNSWIEAIEEDGLYWKNLSDLKGKDNTAAIKYGVNGVPSNFLINDKGIIIEVDIKPEVLENILNQKL
uniref:peroxiredoxin family protein n=1 Tax=Gelidibacter sp. TaxID=2018083 RepID=UPI00404B636E